MGYSSGWVCGGWQSTTNKQSALLRGIEKVHFPHLLLILYFYQKKKTYPGSAFWERLGVVEATSKIWHELLVLLSWQFAYLVAFLWKIYLLSCVREELRVTKVQWTREAKERVPAIKYLTRIDLIFQCIHNKFFYCYLFPFSSVGWWSWPEILMACESRTTDSSSSWLSVIQPPALLPFTIHS